MLILKRCIIYLDQMIPYWALHLFFGVSIVAFVFEQRDIARTFAVGMMLISLPKMLRWMMKD